MKQHLRKIIKNGIIVLLLMAAVSGLRFYDFANPLVDIVKKCFIFAVYEVMAAAWGISIMRRIMHKQVRQYFIAADVVMMIWFVIRTLKWYVFTNPPVSRVLWYLYYVPQLILVYCTFAACECVAERDEEKQIREKFLAFVQTVLLSAIMVTNELHQFAIKIDPVTGNTIHWVGYYMVVVWTVLITILSVMKLHRKSEEKSVDLRTVLPYVTLLGGGVYYVVYFIRDWQGYPLLLEYTAGFTMFTIFFLESLIITGLIPSNIDYEWCFMNAGVKAQILNKGGRVIYKSSEAKALTKEEVRELMTQGKSLPDEDTELQAVHIRGGFVVWERNNMDINNSIRQLVETGESVKEATQTLEESISVEKRRKAISEQNRLYDITFSLVSDKLKNLHELIDKARRLDGKALADTLKMIDLCGVYVKRKSNLIILSEQTLVDFAGELKLCFKESFDNLSDAGVEAEFYFNNISGVDFSVADETYACLEEVIERTLNNLQNITAIVAGGNGDIRLTIDLKLNGPYGELLLGGINDIYRNADYEIDDNNVTVSFDIKKGGGQHANL